MPQFRWTASAKNAGWPYDNTGLAERGCERQMFGMDRTKTQGEAVPSPESQPGDVIVSPDTRRSDRLPPGQVRTLKWPILDASGAPEIELATWTFGMGGLVGKEVEWDWQEFVKLPRVRV